MAILGHDMKYLWFIIMFLAVAGTGYTASGKDGDYSSFPHEGHIEKMSCVTCHSASEDKTPEFPDQEKCKTCHKDKIPWESAYPEKRKTNTDLPFPHGKHSDKTCTVCHHLDENKAINAEPSTACLKCHEANDVTPDCISCHQTEVMPGYHSNAWRMDHSRIPGQMIETDVHGNDCRMCHRDPVCISCHHTMKPLSHNGFFRLRGHGLQAAIDSQTCKTCHQERTCIQCHREIKPLNHKGRWENSHGRAAPGGLNGPIGNCAVCHQPAWCTRCHNR